MKPVCFFLLIVLITSCNKTSESGIDYGYGPSDALAVTVGSQIWTAKNLNVKTFANGDSIPEAKMDDDWRSAGAEGRPAWCYYMGNSKNGKIYGKLYNWHAVSDPRGLAPKGWHIPNDMEWTVLLNNLGGKAKAGASLKSTYDWSGKNNGNDSSGLSFLPGGDRYLNGGFLNMHDSGYWWSSSDDPDTPNGLCLWINWVAGDYVYRDPLDKGIGMSVRCVKD